MVGITIFGGVGEIGGNKILVDHQDSRIMLDFGSRMGFASEFFSDFLDVRSNTELKDKLTIGILPTIPGIYRKHLIRPDGVEELSNNMYGRVLAPDSELITSSGLQTYEEYYQEHGRGYIDGLFISHAHLDHTGDIKFIHPSIPLYCSKTTKTLINAIDEVTTFKSEAIKSKGSKLIFSGDRSSAPGSPKVDHKEVLVRDCRMMSDGNYQNPVYRRHKISW
jgi:ribonuclease J